MGRSDENGIIDDILSGDSHAYAILVRRYQKPIYNLMIRMTGNNEDAFDLTQDTFLRAYERLEQFRRGKSFFSWLYSIGMNLAKDHFRGVRRSRVGLDALSREAEFDPLHNRQPTDVLLDAQKVKWALTRIPEDYREAVVLRFHEDLSFKEVADCLNLSLSGAKMRVHRGLAMLKDILSPGGDK